MLPTYSFSILLLIAVPLVAGGEDEPSQAATPTPAQQDQPQQVPAPTAAAVTTAPQQSQFVPPGIFPAELIPYQFKPESKDELFGRIDVDNDQSVNIDDYLKRDKYYVESVKNEFNQIDANQDLKVTKQEFDDYIKKLEEQRRKSLLQSSNYTLTKHDANRDRKLSQAELGGYINGTLQRSIDKLADVFKEFDKDGDGLLNLDEFSELDFHFPWEKFPLSESAQKALFGGQTQSHGIAIPPPAPVPAMYRW